MCFLVMLLGLFFFWLVFHSLDVATLLVSLASVMAVESPLESASVGPLVSERNEYGPRGNVCGKELRLSCLHQEMSQGVMVW